MSRQPLAVRPAQVFSVALLRYLTCSNDVFVLYVSWRTKYDLSVVLHPCSLAVVMLRSIDDEEGFVGVSFSFARIY